MRFGPFAFIPVLALLPFVPARAADAAACQQAVADAREHKNDIAALEHDYRNANDACDADTLSAVADQLAFALFNAARKTEGAARRDMLTRAASLTRDWRIHATLGGDMIEAREHAAAAETLQIALLDIQEREDAGASEKIVRKIITMANNARALAGEYKPNVRTRSGEPGGVAATEIGGVQIEALPFPVEFEFAEATPTPDGDFAILDLVDILTGVDAATLTLAGHTDPVGGQDYNLALSRKRAAAVRDALVAARVRGAGSMRVVGCGETSPPDMVGAEHYSEEDIHQIMRRVELVRSGAACR